MIAIFHPHCLLLQLFTGKSLVFLRRLTPSKLSFVSSQEVLVLSWGKGRELAPSAITRSLLTALLTPLLTGSFPLMGFCLQWGEALDLP